MHARSKNQQRLICFALVVVLAMLALPFVSGPAEASDVNVLAKDPTSVTLRAESSIQMTWAVYNNGTSPVVVKTTIFPTDVNNVGQLIENDFITLYPGDSEVVSITFTAGRNIRTSDVTYMVNFTSTRLDDPSFVNMTTDQIDISLQSIWGVESGQNKLFNIWPNTLPPPLDGNLGAFAVTSICWVLIGLGFYFIVDPAVHMATKKTKTELDDILLRILRLPVFLLIVLVGIVGSLEILSLAPDVINEIETWYRVVLILIGVWLSYKIYKELILFYAKKYASKTETEMDDVLVPLLEKIGMIIIPFIGLMLIFEIFGYDVTVLLAGAGFLGIVVGFAAQSTLANFFAGLQLMIERPFKVGDKLWMEGDFFEVKHVGLRATELWDTTNNQTVIIPNDMMANNKIVNSFLPDKELTVTVVVGVGYGSDIELVKRLMVESYNEMSNSVKTKVPTIRLSEFADSSINMKIFIPIDDANAKWKAASDFREILYRKFNAAGVEIPFPQRVIYIKDERKSE